MKKKSYWNYVSQQDGYGLEEGLIQLEHSRKGVSGALYQRIGSTLPSPSHSAVEILFILDGIQKGDLIILEWEAKWIKKRGNMVLRSHQPDNKFSGKWQSEDQMLFDIFTLEQLTEPTLPKSKFTKWWAFEEGRILMRKAITLNSEKRQEAIILFEQAKAAFILGERPKELSKVNNQLVGFYAKDGNFQKVDELTDEIKLQRHISSANELLDSLSSSTIAHIDLGKEMPDIGALSSIQEVNQPKSSQLLWVAKDQFLEQKYKDTLLTLKQAQEEVEKETSPNRFQLSQIFEYRAIANYHLQEYNKGIEAARAGIALFVEPKEEILGLNNQLVLAQLLDKVGKPQTAERQYKKVLALQAKVAPSGLWVIMAELAKFYWEQQQIDKADYYFNKSIEKIEEYRASLQKDSSRIGYFQFRFMPYHQYCLFLLTQGKSQQAFDIMQGARSKALIDLLNVKEKSPRMKINFLALQKILQV